MITPKQIIDSFEASSAGHFQPRMNGNKTSVIKKRNLLPPKLKISAIPDSYRSN